MKRCTVERLNFTR